MRRPIVWCVAGVFLLVAVGLAGNQQGVAEELKVLQLSQPRLDKGRALMAVLKERKSSRSFNSKELPLEVLSDLLWAAFGVNRPESDGRTAPSASNRKEIDIYVAMERGLYLYDPDRHILDPVMAKDIRSVTGKQEFVARAPVDLIYIADFARMGGDEATKIFYSAADTGFISQNVYLFSASEGLSTVILGMVDKQALAQAMNLKNDQRVILTQPVGYPE